jgi:hypothetical protein
MVTGAGTGPSAALWDVLPALVSAVTGRAADGLAPDPVSRACLLLVDGLGWELLRRHRRHAPFLTSLAERGGNRGPLNVGFPATTSTSMGSLGTGLPSGGHGIVGYEIAVPGRDLILNTLTWDDQVDPLVWQPVPTWFERAAAAGVAVTRVGPAFFDGSGLTTAALRGGRFAPAESMGERVATSLAAMRAGGPALVYCYYGDLDATGHRDGCESEAWELQLEHVDRMAEQLADRLPPDSLLWITGDHGMVDVPARGRLDVAGEPELTAGVRVLAGEPRARHVHTVPGAAGDVLAAWRERLGARAVVLSRDEAVAAGWFGPTVSARVRSRIGEVVAISRGSYALVDSTRMDPVMMALVGMHGSTTPEEVLVPLLEVRR